MKRKALVIGATGATGSKLVELLKENLLYEQIYLLHYRDTGMADGHRVFDIIQSFDELMHFRIDGIDDVFCCIGTTIKKAGSKEEFTKVDKDYVIELGKWAKIELVNSFHVISYLGADTKSSVFYNRVKGEMEAGLISLNLAKLYIYQPPILKAKRKEFRLGERIGISLLTLLSPLLFGNLRNHRPLSVKKMAAAMIDNALHAKKGVHFIDPLQMQAYK
jgi:uncharacterized protein YbjT (DUF2867 family)